MAFSLDDTHAVKPRIAGLFLMPLRWVCAWILFAAGWRRLVLKPESLNPHSALYEGIKLNHFLAHAMWTKMFLNYVVTHPQALLTFLWFFTIVELTIGVLLLIGFGTRFLGLILIFLFINLMLVAGWMGTTCLDEWTVATFGIGIGMCLFLAGSGPYSVDALIFRKFHYLVEHRWWGLFISPELSFIHHYKTGKRYALVISALTLGFVLFTNQYFVGGVWGPFHNPAVSMNIKLHADLQKNGDLALTLYRNQGADTYGAFIVDVAVKNAQGNMVVDYGVKQLSTLKENQIHNYYLVQAKPNANSLVLPLGSLATLSLVPSQPAQLKAGDYQVTVTDVSGKSWTTPAVVGGSMNGVAPFNPISLLKL